MSDDDLLARALNGEGIGDKMRQLELLAARLLAAEAERDEARRRLLSAAGDDLCRLTQEEIKAMTAGEVQIPPKDEFLASCERFHAQVAGEAGVMTNCLTLAQLIAENESLTGVLRSLASYVGAGGYNAPEVDAQLKQVAALAQQRDDYALLARAAHGEMAFWCEGNLEIGGETFACDLDDNGLPVLTDEHRERFKQTGW